MKTCEIGLTCLIKLFATRRRLFQLAKYCYTCMPEIPDKETTRNKKRQSRKLEISQACTSAGLSTTFQLAKPLKIPSCQHLNSASHHVTNTRCNSGPVGDWLGCRAKQRKQEKQG
jgi:hypothetical protein